MAKKSVKNKIKKTGKKPVNKASKKVVQKNKKNNSSAKPQKVIAELKKAKPISPKAKTVAKSIVANKSKSVVLIKPIVKKEIVKVKNQPIKDKTLVINKIKSATSTPIVAVTKSKKIIAPLPPPPPSNLPKLPKGFVLKKQKGKLAPGEKRLFKTNVITHHVISEISLEDEKKAKPEPKGKFQLEYIIHTPVTLLYDFLTTPNGLAEWFADGVDMKNDIYTFDWDGQKQNAKILNAKIDTYIRLRWLDKPEGSYFEFRLDQDELTNEVSLTITDFGESEDDIATSRRLWDSQIQRLVKALGTY